MSDFDAHYSSAGLGAMAIRIPELGLPTRPRFVEDLLCLPLADGCYVLGAEPAFLGGTDLPQVFDVLVPRLDGTRTIAELAAESPELEPRQLLDVLALLTMHGFLEDAAAEKDSACTSSRTDIGDGGQPLTSDTYQATFYSRYLRLTGRHKHRSGAMAALADSSVLLLTGYGYAAEHAASVRATLRAHGIGRVVTSSLDRNDWVNSESACIDVMVVLGAVVDHAAYFATLSPLGVPILFSDPDSGVIGPYTLTGVSPCPECVRLQLNEFAGTSHPTGSAALARAFASLIVQRLAMRVLVLLSGVFDVGHAVDVEHWQRTLRCVRRHTGLGVLPSCPLCGQATPRRELRLPSGHRENVALWLHRAAALKPWQLESPASMQRHLEPEIVRMTQVTTRDMTRGGSTGSRGFPALSATTALDVPYRASYEDATRWAQVERATLLGALLGYSAGVCLEPVNGQRSQLRRRTASGGNLGSAELFVALRDGRGENSTLHRYEPLGHVLQPLGCALDLATIKADWPDGATRGDSERASDVPALIIVASRLRRLYYKYGQRAYLYAQLDAGAMAQRVVRIAVAFGLKGRIAWNFDEAALLDSLCRRPPDDGCACLIRLEARS